METATHLSDGNSPLGKRSGMEDLATNHFERVFLLFGAFFEDPKVTMGFTESAFRAAEQTGTPSPSVLYQCARARGGAQPAGAIVLAAEGTRDVALPGDRQDSGDRLRGGQAQHRRNPVRPDAQTVRLTHPGPTPETKRPTVGVGADAPAPFFRLGFFVPCRIFPWFQKQCDQSKKLRIWGNPSPQAPLWGFSPG